MSRFETMHAPVLLKEALLGLQVQPSGRYIDATFGRGGHSQAILDELDADGRLLAIDQDPSAIVHGQQFFDQEPRLRLCHGSFADVTELSREFCQTGIDGLLMDLGVSSPQLDEAQRGFSFMNDGPLDMRMNTSVGQNAAQWLNSVDEVPLANVLWQFGEERFSRRIARFIVQTRVNTPFDSTLQLAQCIAKAVPKREPHKHPATRSFQAIRIFINDELGSLQRGLNAALGLLKPGGRLCVISFHSLEDRMVKQFMQRQAQGDPSIRHLALSDEQRGINLKLIGKVKPSSEEVAQNPRARSAILRIGEKL